MCDWLNVMRSNTDEAYHNNGSLCILTAGSVMETATTRNVCEVSYLYRVAWKFFKVFIFADFEEIFSIRKNKFPQKKKPQFKTPQNYTPSSPIRRSALNKLMLRLL